MTAAPPLIAFAHVGKSFDGGGVKPVLAVDDVSLDVAEGELLAIVGASGSGKTTLLRLGNRLIETDSGRHTGGGGGVRAGGRIARSGAARSRAISRPFSP